MEANQFWHSVSIKNDKKAHDFQVHFGQKCLIKLIVYWTSKVPMDFLIIMISLTCDAINAFTWDSSYFSDRVACVSSNSRSIS